MINDQPTLPTRTTMATELPTTNGSAQNDSVEDKFTVKTGLARMLKGGVIMDVVNAEQVTSSHVACWVCTCLDTC